MPWYAQWSESIKKRACRYLLQRYVGHYLKEKLTLDQLSVDLYKGTGTITTLNLDVDGLNEMADMYNLPIEFVDGYIESISVSIPWSSLLTDNSFVQVSGLMMTIKPRYRHGSASTVSSMWGSMTTSMQLAQECLLQDKGEDIAKPVEGLESFAETIDSVLCRIKVRFLDTIIRMEHVPKGRKTGVALEIRIKKMDYFDTASVECSSLNKEELRRSVHEPAAFSCKTFHWEGVMLYSDEFSSNSRILSKSVCSSGSSPESKDARTSETYSTAPDTPELGNPQSVFEFCIPNPEDVVSQTMPTEPILISKLSGIHEIQLKLKQNEAVPGAKASLDCSIGSVVVFVSPRQVHVLMELLRGFTSPDAVDIQKPDRNYGSCNKPMQPTDFERVERELQKQLSHQVQGRSLQQQQGWSSQSLDSDDDYQPFDSHGNLMTTSGSSVASYLSDSSTNTSNVGFKKSRESYLSHHVTINEQDKRKRQIFTGYMPLHQDDSLEETTYFKLRLHSLAIIILHDDILTQSVDGSGAMASISVQQMKSQAEKFFNDLGIFHIGGGIDRDLQVAHEKLSATCKANHLRVMAAPFTVEGQDKTSSTSRSFYMTLRIGMWEVVECLFDSKPSSSQSLPEYSVILSFPCDNKVKGGSKCNSHISSDMALIEPCLKVTLNHMEPVNHQQSKKRNIQPPKTKIECHMAACVSEVDISIVDRINCLLNPQEFNGSGSQSLSHFNNQGYIAQAMEDGVSNLRHKLELSIISQYLVLKVRFPIPDLRPLHDMDRAPWWKKNIRDDVLILELTEAHFNSNFDEMDPCWSFDIQCKDLHGLFQETPKDPPISFLRASSGINSGCNSHLDADEGFDWPRLSIIIRPPTPLQTLEEHNPEDVDDSIPVNSLDTLVHQLCASDSVELSPFSSRKVVYGSDHSIGSESGSHDNHKKQQEHSIEGDQMVIPGERSEVADFIEQSTNNCQVVLELSLANLNIVLPNKHFYEVLYNRVITDLLLWEPAKPKPVIRDSINVHPSSVNLEWANSYMPETVFQTFTSCKSALAYDSSSESEEENPSYYSFYEHKVKQKKYQTQKTSKCHQNKTCISVNVKQASLTLCTPYKDTNGKILPEYKGELQLQLVDGTFFVVSEVQGSPTKGFVCFHANWAKLYHKGRLPSNIVSSDKVPPADMLHPHHLNSTIFCSENGTYTKTSGLVGTGGDSLDMLLLAIRINMDTSRNVKTFRVALGVRGSTLRYYVCPSNESWFAQCMDFFDVVDYPVMGYSPPDVVIELHLHTWGCAIDYRPLYLPLRAVVTMESFSVCSNIAAQTSTSVIRVIIEDACVFLSKKLNTSSVDLKRDYVCVINMSFFELSLQTSDGRNQTQPKVDLRASSNIIHIRTCVDSCCALQELLCYIASDGDLKNNDNHVDQESEEDYGPSSLQSDTSTLTNVEEEHVHSLMAEAMKESNAYCSVAGIAGVEGDHVSLELPPSPSELFLFPDETPQLSKPPSSLNPAFDSGCPSFVEPVGVDSSDPDSTDSDDGFCILENDPGVGILPKTGKPQIRMLTTEPVHLIENHFSVPLRKMDQLKAPKSFPQPVLRYTLREISLVWHLYGGLDFPRDSTEKDDSQTFAEAYRNEASSADNQSLCKVSMPNGASNPNVSISFNKSNHGEVHWKAMPGKAQSPLSNTSATKVNWQERGGSGRQLDCLMELQLNKVRFQHEKYPETTSQASRQILLIQEVEIRDRLASSQINKFLYLYTSESMPRQSHANMVVIKAVHLRADPLLPRQECALKFSVLPLRLNIDQDALFFLCNFFGNLSSNEEMKCMDLGRRISAASFNGGSSKNGPNPFESIKNNCAKIVNTHSVPVMTVVTIPCADTPSSPLPRTSSLNSDSAKSLISFDDTTKMNLDTNDITCKSDVIESSPISTPIFFRSFLFSPDVPIRLDYQGKHVDMEQGALTGLLIGLGQLSCSELRLKRISYRQGLLGVDRLVTYVLNEWLQDIKHTQLPSLLGGVGPLHSLIQLCKGVRDLFWLPVEQYRKDGRIVRGLQRGANAFTTSTAMAILELANRLVQAVQCTAETAYDVVSPGPSVKKRGVCGHQRRKRPSQPADIREGMANAYHVVKQGLGDTARTLVQVASEEHEHKGISGAVGGVLRQIPSTVVKPIILATEATSNVLGGMRHQLAPDARREAAEKWRIED